MSNQVASLVSFFESRWPLQLAESWDTPGLVAGSPKQPVDRVILTVDVTLELLEELKPNDLVLAHHPLLLRGVNTVAESTSKGAILAAAIKQGIAIYAAHTNADVVENGVSDTLAKVIGLKNLSPLIGSDSEGVGTGRIGNLAEVAQLGDLARHIARVIPSTASGVKVAGDYSLPVERVALCGGAGDSFLQAALESDADVYITSDLRHHPASDFKGASALRDKPIGLIDISHWAAEWMWLEQAATEIRRNFADVIVEVSGLNTDPWDFCITQ